ncbi:MAG TPA: hypothetical protein VGI39_36860 [Polyangiaceae bacterium]|jgi:hypothetical protein
MDAPSVVSRIESLFDAGDGQGALELLRRTIADAQRAPVGARIALVDALAKSVGHRHPRVGATFAMAGGAVVESGVSGAALARAILAPLGRALVSAARFVDLAAKVPSSDKAGLPFFDRMLDERALDRIAKKDPEALDAYISLDTWYRPAVATWSREPAVLRSVQADAAWREPLAPLGAACSGSHWLSLLLGAVFDAPFVFVFPELGEGWSARLDGVTDTGQLMVLLAAAMPGPLARIHAGAQPTAEVLAVMSGDGPQQIGSTGYSSSFQLWPWQARNPETGFPESNRFTWLAPGGRGSHSLPADFQPGAIDAVAGARVLLVTGPKAPADLKFTRAIAAARMFVGLRAGLTSVGRLPAGELRTVLDAIGAATRG